MKKRLCMLAVAVALALSGVSRVSAASITPTSYDTPNGYQGTFTYYDDSYNGTGNNGSAGAPLTGGLGDLTDGVVAVANWFTTPGPYVGWNGIDPTINFHFAAATSFDSVRIYFDDSNGAGGVQPPASVVINGTNFAVTDPASGAPFSMDFALNGLTTNQLDITLNRKDSWVFASEFSFTTTAVPEPATMSLLAAGAIGLVGARLRKRKVAAPAVA